MASENSGTDVDKLLNSLELETDFNTLTMSDFQAQEVDKLLQSIGQEDYLKSPFPEDLDELLNGSKVSKQGITSEDIIIPSESNETESTPIILQQSEDYEPPASIEQRPSVIQTEVKPQKIEAKIIKKEQYTEKELEKLRYQVIKQGLESSSILNLEIQSLEEKYNEEIRSKTQLQQVIQEYENTILGFIAEANAMNSNTHNGNISIPEKVYQIEHEIYRIVQESNSIEAAFKQLTSRLDDIDILHQQFKKSESTLKEKLSALEQDLAVTESRYNALKTHAEQKLDSASEKVAQFTAANQKEIENLADKLTKSEAKSKTLEQVYIAKLRENQDLQQICEGKFSKFFMILTLKLDILSKLELTVK